jgi:hypothetical protein
MAELVGLAATANAGVQLRWTYDSDTSGQGTAQGYTDAAPAGLRRMAISAPAVKQLSLVANNTTGAPVAGFRLNYEVQMRRLSVVEKLLRGYNLNSQDQKMVALLGPEGLRQVTDLVERGTSPIDITTQLQRTWLNRRLKDHSGSGLYHATAGANTTFATIMAAQGEVLVLEELAVEGGSALGSTLTVYVDRDEDENYMQVTGNNFAQADDAPWQVMVPALRSLTFRAASSGAPLANVPIRIRVGRYRLSNLLKVRLGLAKGPDEVPGDTFAKVMVGIS